jgi:hypothetical protein
MDKESYDVKQRQCTDSLPPHRCGEQISARFLFHSNSVHVRVSSHRHRPDAATKQKTVSPDTRAMERGAGADDEWTKHKELITSMSSSNVRERAQRNSENVNNLP